MRAAVLVVLVAYLASCGSRPLDDVEVCKRAMTYYYKDKDATDRAIAADRLRCEDALKSKEWLPTHYSRVYRSLATAQDARDGLKCERAFDGDYTCAAIKAQKGHEGVACEKWSAESLKCYLEYLNSSELRTEYCSAKFQADDANATNERLKSNVDALAVESEKLDQEYAAVLEQYKGASESEKPALDEKLKGLLRRKQANSEAKGDLLPRPPARPGTP